MAAAYGGGGLGLLSAGRLRPGPGRGGAGPPGDRRAHRGRRRTPTGVYGGHHRGEPIRMVVLGDSSACGLGVEAPHQTPGAMLAAGIAECADRPVDVTVVAVVGAQSSDLVRPGRAGRRHAPPDVAVIMIGANDVTHRVRPPTAVRHLDQAVRRLRELGAEVVVGTCPDLGTVEPVPQPLRWIARRSSRQLAAAQTIAVVEAGGRTVSLGDILGPEFAASPSEMFGPDRLPPVGRRLRQRGRRACCPRCARRSGSGSGPSAELAPDLARGEGVRPVSRGRRRGRRRGRHRGRRRPGRRPGPRPARALGAAAAAASGTDGSRTRTPAAGRTRTSDAPAARRLVVDWPVTPAVRSPRRSAVPEAVIVATARSPIGRAFKGSLVDVRPDDLAGTVDPRRARQGARPRPGRRSTT